MPKGLSQTNAASFNACLTKVSYALQAGHLVRNDFKVIEKHGIKWVWIKFVKALEKMFICCNDPWKAYRINALSTSLMFFVNNNKEHMTDETTAIVTSILDKLKLKADHSSNKRKSSYLQALNNWKAPTTTKTEKKPINPTIAKALKDVPPDTVAMVRNAIIQFGNTLCNELASKNPNQSFAVSPLSIVVALSIGLHIIKPENKELFIEKLGLKGLSEEEVQLGVAATIQTLLGCDFQEGTIDVVQGLAYKEGQVVGESLLKLVTDVFNGDAIVSNQLMDAVNAWVSAKTQNKIPTLLADNSAELVLLNAVYLNLLWKDKFIIPSGGWDVVDFTCADGSKAPVSMMVQTGHFPIYCGQAFDMLEKPYTSPEGRKFSQLIFLPKDHEKLHEVHAFLAEAKAETLQSYRRGGGLESVNLSLPKTKASSAFNLLNLLEEMGFPLETLDETIVGSLELSAIIHKTYVATDEKGTEAAAVTGMIISKSLYRVEPPINFTVDRAYSYLIVDENNTVYFRGLVADKTPLVVDSSVASS